MILHSPTGNENTDFIMAASTAGIEVRKDASGDIHFDLDSSTPCWNDATAVALLELTEVRPPIFSKANKKVRKLKITESEPFVLLYFRICARRAIFSHLENSRIRIFLAPRRPRTPSSETFFYFAPLRLCGKCSDSFGCGFAALGASWLRRDFVYQHGQ